MKNINMFCCLFLIACSSYIRKDFDLFVKIENQEIILKTDLEGFLNRQFVGYENEFIGSGDVVSSGNVKAGVVQGKKENNIFDILIVFRGNECVSVVENPNSSFYKKKGSIYKEYVLGAIYTSYKETDTSCIVAYIQKYEPFKVDTLGYMLHKSQLVVSQEDILEFCPANSTELHKKDFDISK